VPATSRRRHEGAPYRGSSLTRSRYTLSVDELATSTRRCPTLRLWVQAPGCAAGAGGKCRALPQVLDRHLQRPHEGFVTPQCRRGPSLFLCG
jgi:hypothetical protein